MAMVGNMLGLMEIRFMLVGEASGSRDGRGGAIRHIQMIHVPQTGDKTGRFPTLKTCPLLYATKSLATFPPA